MQGNAGAGGVFLALAADRVWARSGIVLNPHYKSMGNLYGSEYWTYLLPRRVGEDRAQTITQSRMPFGAREATDAGLVDRHFGETPQSFRAEVAASAQRLAADAAFGALLDEKNERRRADEAVRPLAAYRVAELDRMRLNFYGFDSSYHVARHHFVAKVPHSRTPLWLARHRAGAAQRMAA
jgi:putative two-component system hydrogenase maturation factor HypX/HoxX